MKKPLRRRRFFALGEERTHAIIPSNHRLDAPAPHPHHPPRGHTTEDEEFTEGEFSPDPSFDVSDEAEDALPPGFALSRVPRPRSPKKRGLRGWVAGMLALGCLAVGAWIGYLLPKAATTAPGASAQTGTREKSSSLAPAEQEAMDAAFTARTERRFDEARQGFAALRQAHSSWEWIDLEANRTLLYEGKVIEARMALLGIVDKAPQSAEANYLLGVAYLIERAFDSAEEKFARAVALDPTRPEYYYFWGDCLRTEGKPREAAAKFRAALLRNSFETADGFYRLKLWLCEIEADLEDHNGLSAKLDTALASAHPAMEALGAAAARSIKQGDFKTAKSRLDQLRQTTSAVIFRVILGDPIFKQFQTQPELAQFFRPDPADAEMGANPFAAAPSPKGE